MTLPSLVDLAAERLGAAVVAANDEFFAAKENLITREAPIWREGEYTDRGKWMDGWETRRRRDVDKGDHDWCIVRLGARGVVSDVDVETTFFTGNYPESCAIDACDLEDLRTPDELERADWWEILPRTRLTGHAHNPIEIGRAPVATYLRLRIYPDGGVARLRVHGEVVADWARLRRRGEVDLAAVEHGGSVVGCSDMFYGSGHNLIMPGESRNMGDGWQTQRRRGPGHDWTIVRLGAPGTVRRIEIDTRHFKGNAPGACSLEAAVIEHADLDTAQWRDLIVKTTLRPHARHIFEDQVQTVADATHVRLNIFPDGGVGRLRLFGNPR